MKYVLTGANGFLGWHTRARIRSRRDQWEQIPVGKKFLLEDAVASLEGAERVIHLAGVNRGTDYEIESGNLRFAHQLGSALESVSNPPQELVFANTIQAGNGTSYGQSKSRAADVLAAACRRVGTKFLNVELGNIFGEHGKPFYNSVVATFCHLLSEGGKPEIRNDREIDLLHGQQAAAILMGETDPSQTRSHIRHTVGTLLTTLENMAAAYSHGEIPDLSPPGSIELFNTYRSFLVGPSMPIMIKDHRDARGSFYEAVRSHGGSAQTSFSTTSPGITRGQHYHLSKIERFTVLSGEANISMRRLLTKDVLSFKVSGTNPVSLDMPTFWAHKIENVGTEPLYTMFWTNEIFDPSAPDTFAEEV